MKRIWLLAAAALAGFGIAAGNSMSAEAMGVVVGVVLGVAAAIPMALLVMLFVARRDRREEPQQEQPPTVLIVDGRGIPQYPTAPDGCYWQGTRLRQIGGPRGGVN
jgi:Mg-chelatase subunit ChlD